MNTEFDAFVKREQAEAAHSASVDWAKVRQEWLDHLKHLYHQTESFLAEYVQSGQIKIEYREIEINEESIGSYKARQMFLKIGRQEITMTPVGTLLIGATGRVDVVGPFGRTRFVLVDSKASRPSVRVAVSVGRPKPRPEETRGRIHWVWKIATSPPTVRYIELTQDSLYRALIEVANG